MMKRKTVKERELSEEEESSAVSLYCPEDQAGPSSIVMAIDNRAKHVRSGRKVGSFRAAISLSKLLFVSEMIRYNAKESKWENVTKPYDGCHFQKLSSLVGVSSDATYSVTKRWCDPKNRAHLLISRLAPDEITYRHTVVLRNHTPCHGECVYFHPSSRFVCVFTFVKSDFMAAFESNMSEASVFQVHTMFPSLSVVVSLSCPATIVCRRSTIDGQGMKKEYLRLFDNGYVLNTGTSLNVVIFSHTMPTRTHSEKRVWRVIKSTSVHELRLVPYSISIGLGEELSVYSSIRVIGSTLSLSHTLVECNLDDECISKCEFRKPLFVSRYVVCIESAIERYASRFVRNSKQFSGATYVGSRDYEADVHNITDENCLCRIVIRCVIEIQMPLDGEEGATRNRFYLVQIVAYWSPQDGWYPRCDCKVITELNHEVAFNPRLWYCYENFPSERNEYTYRIPRRHVLGKDNVVRVYSPYSNVELTVDDTFVAEEPTD
ncbi:hypothetical protein Q1695_013170 [Nippostrongylus brasiliensis]|nr:hypothetical protein Q1695_013170 [Nippostrongylus brasiliensis]